MKKKLEELEIKRDEITKKMSSYLDSKKGTTGENILDSTTKIKKTITKVDLSSSKIEEDSDDTDDSDSDDDSEDNDTDDEATPAGPVKKERKIIKFNSNNKKKDSDSDSD
jgi:hypothetical protein